MLVEVDMRVGMVCGLVGEIDWWEEGFTLNGQYRAYSLDIACACKLLVVAVEVVVVETPPRSPRRSSPSFAASPTRFPPISRSDRRRRAPPRKPALNRAWIRR